MTTQSALLGFLIATACGLVFHLIRGGGLRRIGLYVATAWVTFFIGHWFGEWVGWRALRFGPLNLLPALLATLLGLLASGLLAGGEKSAGKSRFRRPPDDLGSPGG